MKRGALVVSLGLCASGSAVAGGLFLPGSGAVSTSRAGTGVASTEGGEAIALNPAGIAKSKGTTITIGAAIINYVMSFQRAGTYDMHDGADEPYEGQPYPLVENKPSPPLGIGAYQPVPLVAVTTDLGGAVPGLTVGAGIYAPNAYPFRNLNEVNGQPYFVKNGAGNYEFPTTFDRPPPPSRYDIIEQEAAIILPSIVAAYRILPELDVGGRFSAGTAHVKSNIAVWGGLANYPDWIQKDALFGLDASGFVTSWGLGLTYRPTPVIEIGANYNAQMNVHAEGEAVAKNGPAVDLGGTPIVLQPVPDEFTRCARGGTADAFKGCVDFATPMTATVGGRYKFLDANGELLGDIELNVDWQNWGASRASDYSVIVDAQATTASMPNNAIDLKDSLVKHGLRDTYGFRLGGSWLFTGGPSPIVARAGLGYETAAAKEGWERADLDGAARTIATVGGSYKLPRVSIDLGFGYVHEGTRTSNRNCNPELIAGQPPQGCGPGMSQQPVEDRQGPDPINPLVVGDAQAESPVNQGTFKSHYLLFMVGMSTWF